MLIIRLSRVGKRNYAQYKIVVAEKTAPVKGKFVEQVGSYDPHSKKAVLKEDRIKHWLSNGAACSDTVYNLLVGNKIIDGEKRSVPMKAKKSEEGAGGDAEENASEEEGDANTDKGDDREDGKTGDEENKEKKEDTEKQEEKKEGEKSDNDAKKEGDSDDK